MNVTAKTLCTRPNSQRPAHLRVPELSPADQRVADMLEADRCAEEATQLAEAARDQTEDLSARIARIERAAELLDHVAEVLARWL